MYIQYITYNFPMVIELHVCGSLNITKLNKIEKITQCQPIQSPPLWCGNDFFPKNRYYYAFIVQKCKTHIFWMKFHPKTLNL